MSPATRFVAFVNCESHVQPTVAMRPGPPDYDETAFVAANPAVSIISTPPTPTGAHTTKHETVWRVLHACVCVLNPRMYERVRALCVEGKCVHKHVQAYVVEAISSLIDSKTVTGPDGQVLWLEPLRAAHLKYFLVFFFMLEGSRSVFGR